MSDPLASSGVAQIQQLIDWLEQLRANALTVNDGEGQALADNCTRALNVLTVQLGRLFPIQGGPAILWQIIERHQLQAQRNHGQTLERLAERGGLSSCEAVAVLEDREWRPMDDKAARERLIDLALTQRALLAVDAPPTLSREDQQRLDAVCIYCGGHHSGIECQAVDAPQLREEKDDLSRVEPGATTRGTGSTASSNERMRDADRVCEECGHIFTALEIEAEDPKAWGHPCPPLKTQCESHRPVVAVAAPPPQAEEP